jgi:DeoR family transcriptional regulator, aga operon transcriptional repressor
VRNHRPAYNRATMTNAAQARQTVILDVLARDGFIEVGTLQQLLQCSEATIRRDLDQLQGAGLLRRTHGGAVSDSSRELPFTMKVGEMAEAKREIGRCAAELVLDGQAVGFTGGTTTQQIARALARRSGVTAVTNAINIAMEMATGDVRVIVVGGELRGKTYELVGPLAEPLLSQIHLDLMFVGVDGFSLKGGLTTHNPAEARINRVLLERAAQVIVVADHTKLGRKTFAQIAPVDCVSVLITDGGASEQKVEEFRAAGVDVILAGGSWGYAAKNELAGQKEWQTSPA